MALLIAADIGNKETALVFLKVVCKNTLNVEYFYIRRRKSEFNKAGGNVST